MLIFAKRYCRDMGLRSSTVPLCSRGWLMSVRTRPVTLTKPRASPQPADREKSAWVTHPSVTREQWQMTLGRGFGQTPKTTSEAGQDIWGSFDVVVICPEVEGVSEATFLVPFLPRLSVLFKWSLWGGSWGPLMPGPPLLSSLRSSAVGTDTMAWRSGLPFNNSDRRTQTKLIPWLARNDFFAVWSRGGISLTRYDLWPWDEVGPHQLERSLNDFLVLGNKMIGIKFKRGTLLYL